MKNKIIENYAGKEILSSDYELISYGVLINYEMHPFYRVAKKDYKDIDVDLTLSNLSKMLPNPDLMVVPLREKEGIEERGLFNVKDSEVDVNTAIDCGFGVLKMKDTGNLYMFDNMYDNDEDYEDDFNIRLMLYLLATEEGYDSRILERFLNTEDGQERVESLIATGGSVFLNKIKSIFKSKKRGEVITFPNKNK